MNRSEVKTVAVPMGVWGRLATEADSRGVTVQDVLVAAINHVIHTRDRRGVVLALVRAGYPDGMVAEYTGELRQYVGEVRRSAGIAANKSKGAHA